MSDLSHGLRRQLEIRLAIAMRPKITLLHEPATGLFPAEAVALASLIRSTVRRQRNTSKP